jgi:rhodanese-related sulfurtransferase
MEYDTVTSIPAEEFKSALDKDIPVFDVRKNGEWSSEHIENANNTPLDFLNNHLAEFPSDKTFYVHCAGGYRSMIAASILKSRGIHNMIDVAGGMKAIKEAGIPVTDYICPSTLK